MFTKIEAIKTINVNLFCDENSLPIKGLKRKITADNIVHKIWTETTCLVNELTSFL